MPRPVTRDELLSAAEERYDKLQKNIDKLSSEQQNAAFDFGDFEGKEAHWARDKNLRDILIHLYEWHELLLDWIRSNQTGEDKPFLPAPYNWKTYGEMNVGFWEKHQGTSLEEAKRLLEKSQADVMALISTFSDEQLFSKGIFSWTGGTTLGSYCISATSSHYDWAIKKLKKVRF